MRHIKKSDLAAIEHKVEEALSGIPRAHRRKRMIERGDIWMDELDARATADDGSGTPEHAGDAAIYYWRQQEGSRKWGWTHWEVDPDYTIKERERKTNLILIDDDDEEDGLPEPGSEEQWRELARIANEFGDIIDAELDPEVSASLDWWIGTEQDAYDIDGIINDVCIYDEEEALIRFKPELLNEWGKLGKAMETSIRDNTIDYSQRLLTSMSGELIYNGTDSDCAVDAFNAYAGERGWNADGDDAMAMDFDDLVDIVDRREYPVLLVSIHHKHDMSTKLEAVGLRA